MKELSKHVVSGYAPAEPVSLRAHAVTLTVFAIGFGLVARRIGRQRRGYRPNLADVVLLGAGTHKLTRIVAKDVVTAPLRAPFTRREELEGGGEVHDEPRGGGIRRALGTLLTCPYCLGPWFGTALTAALITRPRETRFTLGVMSAVAISDFLHQRYATLNEARKLTQSARKRAELEQEDYVRRVRLS
ncbi:MAG TPA: DUF1360 domain-containing protein [Polyangiaceae bacterium]|nr:DUF1360 domain-containing protein [Polyangiaceae bacterium]